jgi:hypothetical protein
VNNDWNLILDKDRKRKKTKANKGSFLQHFHFKHNNMGSKIMKIKNAEDGL